MRKSNTPAAASRAGIVAEAWQDVGASFERFCLTAGIATLAEMLEHDTARLCGPRHARGPGRTGHRWGRTSGQIGFHGGTVAIERPRVRSRDGGNEMALPSWEAAVAEDWLGRWAFNLMLINVSTRTFGRAVRLPEGDVPAPRGDGRSKSAVSRRFVALSATRLTEWMASDLSTLELLRPPNKTGRGRGNRSERRRAPGRRDGCRLAVRNGWRACGSGQSRTVCVRPPSDVGPAARRCRCRGEQSGR
jgi:putative transposase